MTRRVPRLLMTNDDGIDSPGLLHLRRGLANQEDITVVAPSRQQSGVGMATTLRDPIYVEPVAPLEGCPAWHVSGSPVDCVKMALSLVLDGAPDLIVSGINMGGNEGRNVLYSGTVGAIFEGALRGIPGIAFSSQSVDADSLMATELYVGRIVEYALSHPLPPGTILTVNFPSCGGQFKGVRLCRQGRRYWMDNVDKRKHPLEERWYYWMGCRASPCSEVPDGDVALLDQGYVTVVPLRVGDLTDHTFLKNGQEEFAIIFKEEEMATLA